MVWNVLANIATAVNLYSYAENRKSSRRAEASSRSQANRFVQQAVEDRIREFDYTSPEFLVGNADFVSDIIGRELRFQPLSNRRTIENRFNIYLARNPYYRGNTYTCLLYTSPSPRDRTRSRMPSSA